MFDWYAFGGPNTERQEVFECIGIGPTKDSKTRGDITTNDSERFHMLEYFQNDAASKVLTILCSILY